MNASSVEHTKPDGPARHNSPEIHREVEVRFQQSGYFALRDVSCEATHGVVYLRGRLPSYYLKQVAQAVAARIEGVRRVVNRIEVIAPTRPGPVGCDPATTRPDVVN